MGELRQFVYLRDRDGFTVAPRGHKAEPHGVPVVKPLDAMRQGECRVLDELELDPKTPPGTCAGCRKPLTPPYNIVRFGNGETESGCFTVCPLCKMRMEAEMPFGGWQEEES